VGHSPCLAAGRDSEAEVVLADGHGIAVGITVDANAARIGAI